MIGCADSRRLIAPFDFEPLFPRPGSGFTAERAATTPAWTDRSTLFNPWRRHTFLFGLKCARYGRTPVRGIPVHVHAVGERHYGVSRCGWLRCGGTMQAPERNRTGLRNKRNCSVCSVQAEEIVPY